MKYTLRSFMVVASCSLSLLAFAQVSHGQNFYLDADLGVALADDVKVSRLVVPTPGMKLELDAGPRLSVAGGYHFNDYLGVQIETGFIGNTVSGLSTGGDIDAAVCHVPLLVDVVVRYDKPDFDFVPFAGIGLGGDISIIALDDVRVSRTTVVDGAGSDVVFAWQAFAGARYKFNERISLGAAYKFFSASGARWDVERTSGDIKSGSAQVHSLVVDFTIKF
jgi:opacity protein-like surface antigen